MEPPLISGKTGFPHRYNPGILSQDYPGSLLGKRQTTIYGVSTPENHDIAGFSVQRLHCGELKPHNHVNLQKPPKALCFGHFRELCVEVTLHKSTPDLLHLAHALA